MDDTRAALDRAHAHALDWLDSAAKRGVNATAAAEQLVGALDGPLPDGSADPAEVVDALVAAVEPGLVATTSGRFFGFLIGGTLPAALAADWLTGVWNQNAAFAVVAPRRIGMSPWTPRCATSGSIVAEVGAMLVRH